MSAPVGCTLRLERPHWQTGLFWYGHPQPRQTYSYSFTSFVCNNNADLQVRGRNENCISTDPFLEWALCDNIHSRIVISFCYSHTNGSIFCHTTATTPCTSERLRYYDIIVWLWYHILDYDIILHIIPMISWVWYGVWYHGQNLWYHKKVIDYDIIDMIWTMIS